jgi:hypothetical protein
VISSKRTCIRTLKLRRWPRATLLGGTSRVYITSGGESFWGGNLFMLMVANLQRSVLSWDAADANYLFFQKTPFFCLLNVKQTKIQGYFIFRG